MTLRYFAPRAWLPEGWRDRVLLEVAPDGCWARIASHVDPVPADAIVLAGPALPTLVDAHSHAFQRAFAGLAERSEGERDTFWSWRNRMYRVALRVTPDQLRAIAAHLYVELLQGGYTQVCEFHYLQHASDGVRYDDPLALSFALAEAAAETGIGLTLLPVLYERAGFAETTLRSDQRRFAASADDVWTMQRRLNANARAGLNAGVAVHSLRAAAPASIARLRELAGDFSGPIHIHVAEQLDEVDACLAATGARPVEWLAREQLLDTRWQLVHATHVTRDEIDAVEASGAGVVLCPTTEANLGDGLTDLPGWLASDVPLSVGSDSQVTRSWHDELRLVEYGQRLVRRERNVSAAARGGAGSTAETLFARMVSGSAAPAGFAHWGLVPGARADLVVMGDDPALAGIPGSHAIDAVVFASPARPWRDVMVAGRFLVRDYRHALAEPIAARFRAAMGELWG